MSLYPPICREDRELYGDLAGSQRGKPGGVGGRLYAPWELLLPFA